MDSGPVVSVVEVAERMGVHRQTVFRWIRAGRLPARVVAVDGSQWTQFDVTLGDLMVFDRAWATPRNCGSARAADRSANVGAL